MSKGEEILRSLRSVQIRELRIRPNEGCNTPNRLSVHINGKSVRTTTNEKARWEIEDLEQSTMFEGDTIVLQLSYGNRKSLQMKISKGKLWECKTEILVKDIVVAFERECSSGNDKVEFQRNCGDGEVILSVKVERFDFKALDSLADTFLKDMNVDGKFSFSDVKELKSILGSVFECLDSVSGVEEALKGITSIHPIAQAAVVVVLLPYKVMKNEHDFVERFKDISAKMRSLLHELAVVQSDAKLELATDAIKDIMRESLLFSRYVCGFMSKKKPERIFDAQLNGTKLDGFAKNFEELREAFHRAMTFQAVGGVNTLLDEADRQKLERLLAPATGPRPNDCYDGTREDILQQITDWIDRSNDNNILWISGAPGVGKSAISSSFIRHLEGRWEVDQRNPFAVFYINRQASRDPRSIWRTVAYNLALSIADYRAHLLKTLREDTKGNGVTKQFEVLINVPIESLHQTRPLGIAATIPVIVIDALDECLSEEDSEGDDLLDTIVDWKSLPSSWRLIVFSRREGPIVRRFQVKGVSDSIIIPSGDGVEDDSKAAQDIQTYLKAKFDEISRKFDVNVTPWPQTEVVTQLVRYAAGLFIFPATVIKYVSRLKGDPVGRLRDVVDHMQHWESSSKVFDPIKALYAQILVDTYGSLENDDERESMRLVLAFLAFQQKPLRRVQLVNLLAPIVSDSRESNPFAITIAIDNLMPIITESSAEEDNELVRCNHRTFSEFLNPVDSKDLEDWFENFADSWSVQGAYRKKIDRFREELLPKLTPSAQCLRLAHACLNAFNAEFKFECSSSFKEDETAIRRTDDIPHFLRHASLHWRKYCQLAGEASNDLPLHPYKLALVWMESLNLIAKENNSERGQQKDVETRFKMYQKALRKDFSRSNRNAGHSRPSHHIAETDHHRIVVNPSMQPESETHTLNSLEIQEAELIKLEQLLAPISQRLPRGCQPGTRVSILDRIRKWVKDSVPANPNVEFVGESANLLFAGAGAGPRDSPTPNSNILWISGEPLSGKTAIASSVVALLNSTEFGDVIPNAHYFISEDVDDDPRSVWRTIAYQLALSCPAYMELLRESGVLTTDTKDLNVKDLFEVLIKNPLSRLNIPITVIIDALDECDYDIREEFLKTVGNWKSLPSSCKLIVASRNDNDIKSQLDGTYHIDLESSDESKERLDDIRFLFMDVFEKVERDEWPEDGDIDELVKKAKGSFFWATTVIAFVVNGRGGDPRSRLDDVLRAFKGYYRDTHSSLCAHILMHAHSHLETNDERESMFLVLAVLTFGKAPLSRREFEELLGREISAILKYLSPFLILGPPGELLELTHSYYRFLLRNIEYLGEYKPIEIFIRHLSPSKQSLRLTHACLLYMKKSVKSLVAQADERRKSTGPHHSVNTTRAEDGDPVNVSNALKYACSYWIDHMNDIGRLD